MQRVSFGVSIFVAVAEPRIMLKLQTTGGFLGTLTIVKF